MNPKTLLLFVALSGMALGALLFELPADRTIITMLASVFGFILAIVSQRKAKNGAPDLETSFRMKYFSGREIVRAMIKNVRYGLSLHSDGSVVVGRYEDALLVAWMMNHYLDKKERNELGRAVHEAICAIGRECFAWHRRNPEYNYPDHSLSPLALGYAIKHRALTDEEVASIRFDHGETAEGYAAKAESLLEKVMRQLKEGTAYIGSSPPHRMASPCAFVSD